MNVYLCVFVCCRGYVWDGGAPCGSHWDLERQWTWKVRPDGSGYPLAALGNLTCRGGPLCLPGTSRHMCCVRVSHPKLRNRLSASWLPVLRAGAVFLTEDLKQQTRNGIRQEQFRDRTMRSYEDVIKSLIHVFLLHSVCVCVCVLALLSVRVVGIKQHPHLLL